MRPRSRGRLGHLSLRYACRESQRIGRADGVKHPRLICQVLDTRPEHRPRCRPERVAKHGNEWIQERGTGGSRHRLSLCVQDAFDLARDLALYRLGRLHERAQVSNDVGAEGERE